MCPKEILIYRRTTNRSSCTKKEPPIAINYKHLLTEKTRVYNIFNKTKSDEERASNSPPIDSMTSVHISVLVHMLNERVIKLEETLYKKIKKLK